MAQIDTKVAEENKQRIENEIAPLETFAREVKIKTPDDFLKVADRAKLVKRLIKDNETIFESTIKGYYEPYKFWLGIKNGIGSRLLAIESACKRVMVVYNDEQERIRKAAEDKAAAEAIAKTEKKVEQINMKAAAAEAAGETAKADMLRQSAQETFVTPKPVESKVPEVTGTTFKDNWVGEVVDLSALIKAVAEGRAPENLLMANAPAINKQAKATKDSFKIPGVRFWNEKTISISTR